MNKVGEKNRREKTEQKNKQTNVYINIVTDNYKKQKNFFFLLSLGTVQTSQ